MPPFIATTPDDLPDKQTMLSMSGLEFMLGVLDGRISGPPISGLLNYRLYKVEKSRVVFRGAPLFASQNPMGTVHGGWYGTLLDSAMACAVMTMVPRGQMYTTLEYKINITRPIQLDMEIFAEGIAQHAGRTTGIANGEIRGVADGKLYATGSTTCIIFSPNAR